MHRSRVLLACALALAATVAFAGEQTERTDELVVRAWIPWSEIATGGYVPLFVELRNRTGDTLDVAIDAGASESWLSLEVDRRVALAGGEVRRLEIPLFVSSIAMRADYGVTIRYGGQDVSLYGLGARAASNESNAPTAFFTPVPVDPDDLFPGEPEFVKALNTAVVGYDALPSNYVSLTSLKAALIDVSRGLPSSDALGALAAYVRSGGVLALLGQAIEDLDEAWPDLAAWTEERFLIQQTDAVKAYACGHGALVLSPFGPTGARAANPAAVTGQQAWVIGSLRRSTGGWVPHELPFVAPALPAVSGLAELPYALFALLLIAFAFLIGPVSFFLVKKGGRPVMLLLLVPAVSLVSSGLLLVLALITQGVDVKRTAVSVTVLDQRTHTSTTLEARAFHAGMMPGRGFRPGPGTLCIPDYDNRQVQAWYWYRHGERRFQWSYEDDGLLLKGDFLPPRRRVRHLFITDQPARLRVEVRREGDQLMAENQLGVDLRQFVLRAQDGAYYEATSIAAGERAALTRLNEPNDAAVMRVNNTLGGVRGLVHAVEFPHRVSAELGVARFFESFDGGLPVGSYAARTDASPFLDDCGVSFRDADSVHYLMGVIDLAGDAR